MSEKDVDFLHLHGHAAVELRRKLDAHPSHFDTHLVTDALGDDVGTAISDESGLRRVIPDSCRNAQPARQ